MTAQAQRQENLSYVKKREMTMRTVLNIYGIFVILGFILSIVTTPLSINEQLHFVYDTELFLSGDKIVSLFIFLLGGTLVYFPAINIFYYQLNKREEDHEIDSASA